MTAPKPFKCAVSADAFRRAMFATSTEETRYYLCGVYVEACPHGGATLTATDGHLLISIHDPRGVVEGSAIVSLNATMKKLLSPTRYDRLKERVLLVSHDGSPKDAVAYAALCDPVHKREGSDDLVDPRPQALDLLGAPTRDVLGAQFDEVCIDGTFPDYRRVIPDELHPDQPVGGVDERLLSRAAEALASGKSRVVKLCATAKGEEALNAPIIMTGRKMFSSELDGFAVVMPLRNEGRAQVPAWARPAPVPMAAE